MGFNEKVHAFIAAKFYVYLTEAFGEPVAEPVPLSTALSIMPSSVDAVWLSAPSGTVRN